MKTYTNKGQAQKQVNNTGNSKKNSQNANQQLADNRPAALAQRKLMKLLSGSPPTEGETSLQRVMNASRDRHRAAYFKNNAISQLTPRQSNKTGLPDPLKTGIEMLSKLSLDGIKVHYNSAKPAQLQALAYTQGQDIHIGPGQEKHLPHEAWHVVQQKQGRVGATTQYQGVALNDDEKLEAEADAMGNLASQKGSLFQHRAEKKIVGRPSQMRKSTVIQCKKPTFSALSMLSSKKTNYQPAQVGGSLMMDAPGYTYQMRGKVTAKTSKKGDAKDWKVGAIQTLVYRKDQHIYEYWKPPQDQWGNWIPSRQKRVRTLQNLRDGEQNSIWYDDGDTIAITDKIGNQTTTPKIDDKVTDAAPIEEFQFPGRWRDLNNPAAAPAGPAPALLKGMQTQMRFRNWQIAMKGTDQNTIEYLGWAEWTAAWNININSGYNPGLFGTGNVANKEITLVQKGKRNEQGNHSPQLDLSSQTANQKTQSLQGWSWEQVI